MGENALAGSCKRTPASLPDRIEDDMILEPSLKKGKQKQSEPAAYLRCSSPGCNNTARAPAIQTRGERAPVKSVVNVKENLVR